MNDVHVVIDSTANSTAAMLSVYANLHIVPLKVILGDSQWPEPDLPVAELFRLSGELRLHPRTSQPAPGEFLQLFQSLPGDRREIIVITLSGGVSGTVGSAMTAVRMCGDRGIYIIDSGTTAIGMVHMAEAALTKAAQGWPAQAIVRHIEKMSARTHTMFVPATLEYLYKGGRIGGAAALFGAILQIKPVLYLIDGKVAVLDKIRTRHKAVDRMVAELKKYNPPEYIGIVHIEAAEEAQRLQDQVRALYPSLPVSVTEGGAVLAAHLGPGLVGMIFQEPLPTE